MFTIYLARPERFQVDHYFIPLYLYVSLRLIIYIMVLYWTTSHPFIRFRGCGTAVLLRTKRSGREVQPLAALYPTVRLSPWRQVRKNIHSKVWTPGPAWSVLRSGGPKIDQDFCPGWLPPAPLDLVSPQEGFSPGPHTSRFKRFPAIRILPITFCVFSVWYLT